MRLALLRAALVALAARGVAGQVTSPTTAPPAPAPPPHNSSEIMAVAMTCELLGLVSMNVRGAPNAFCVAANTCNTNYIGNCPGSSAVDSKGQLLVSGSCCAALENTGDVGCVALALVQSGAFQCLKRAGSGESAVVIDISKATPPPTTTAPPPTTTAPPPTTTAPPSTTKAPVRIKTAVDGSRVDAGETSAPPTATTTSPTPTPSSSTTTTATPKPILKPDSSSSSSSVSSGSSSRSHEPPEVGDEPTVSTPQVVPPTTTLPAPTGPLQALAPIPDPPSPSHFGEERRSDHKTTTSSNKNPVPFSGTGQSSTSSGSSFASAMNGNFVIVIVLGTVASVAVVLGALMLRRKSPGKSSSAASSAPTRSSASKLVSPDVKPTLTLDGDEELFEDLQFRPSEHFSPIFVQPTHSYAETRSPGHDRQSYLL